MKKYFKKDQFKKDIQSKRIIELGVSLDVASKAIGISKATLNRIESGKDFDLETFAKCCIWLKCKTPVKYFDLESEKEVKTNQSISPASLILAIAKKEIGYRENPDGSNKTKYGEWFGFNGVEWCGIWVSWVYHFAGFPLGNVGYTKGFAGCYTAIQYFRKKKMIIEKPIPGCLVFHDFDGNGTWDHVSIFDHEVDKNNFKVIEGNKSNCVKESKYKYSKNLIYVNPNNILNS